MGVLCVVRERVAKMRVRVSVWAAEMSREERKRRAGKEKYKGKERK